jgi:group I intron endonuclease
MPYAQDCIGVYKIKNKVTGLCYVGQSQRVRKRVAEHFRLLRRNIHTNPKLQNAFNKYGEEAFEWTLEVECEDVEDLDRIEEAFLSGEAFFEEPTFYNIADFAKCPMRGKRHSDATKQRLSRVRCAASHKYQTPEYRERLRKAQRRRFFSDPAFVAKVRYIVDNPDMSYAERGRVLGADTGSVRRLALKYGHLKGAL